MQKFIGREFMVVAASQHKIYQDELQQSFASIYKQARNTMNECCKNKKINQRRYMHILFFVNSLATCKGILKNQKFIATSRK